MTFIKPSVSKSDKYLPLENTAEDVQKEANVSENKPLSSFFSSAWTKVEGFTKSTTTNFAKEGKKIIEMSYYRNLITNFILEKSLHIIK